MARAYNTVACAEAPCHLGSQHGLTRLSLHNMHMPARHVPAAQADGTSLHSRLSVSARCLHAISAATMHHPSGNTHRVGAAGPAGKAYHRKLQGLACSPGHVPNTVSDEELSKSCNKPADHTTHTTLAATLNIIRWAALDKRPERCCGQQQVIMKPQLARVPAPILITCPACFAAQIGSPTTTGNKHDWPCCPMMPAAVLWTGKGNCGHQTHICPSRSRPRQLSSTTGQLQTRGPLKPGNLHAEGGHVQGMIITLPLCCVQRQGPSEA